MSISPVPPAQKWRVGLALRAFNGSLRQRREQKGWTQKILAAAAGVNINTVNGAESMRSRPTPAAARKIADALECSPADIWPGWLKGDHTRTTVRVYREIEETAFSALEARWKQMLYALPARDEVGELTEIAGLPEAVNDVLAELTPRQRRVLVLRFGLDGGGPRTREEVGRECGVTSARIGQVEAKALRRIRWCPRRTEQLRGYLL